MKQRDFEQAYAADWQSLADLLDRLEAGKARNAPDVTTTTSLPRLYRRVCNHYAVACQRGYSPNLQASLHHLVLRGHQQLYAPVVVWLQPVLTFLSRSFPRAVRRNGGLIAAAAALFFVPAIIMGSLSFKSTEYLYSVVPPHYVTEVEYMYDPTNDNPGRAEERQADTDFAMFGYYIFNNIGLGFQAFASGILLGIGPVISLVYNGLMIGAVAGHVTRLGYSETFWPFVAGHSAFELIAIVLCGAAGLLLARAVFAPGRYTRVHALRLSGSEAIQIIIGAAAMLLVAAFIEAFWSSAVAPAIPVKLTIGAIGWAVVPAYLLLSGHDDDAA